MSMFTVFLLLATAIILGLTVLLLDIARSRTESIAMVIGSAVGGLVGGWYLRSWTAWGAELDGMYLLPGLIGAIVVGGVFEAIVRLVSAATLPLAAAKPRPAARRRRPSSQAPPSRTAGSPALSRRGRGFPP